MCARVYKEFWRLLPGRFLRYLSDGYGKGYIVNKKMCNVMEELLKYLLSVLACNTEISPRKVSAPDDLVVFRGEFDFGFFRSDLRVIRELAACDKEFAESIAGFYTRLDTEMQKIV